MAAKKKTRKTRAPKAEPLPEGPPPERDALLTRLTAAIPEPRCELDHTDGYTLLIATILSAQSTDRTVNTVTPTLFATWPTPAELAAASREEVEQVVHKTGFFRNKAKSIQGAALAIHQDHDDEVPRDLDALIKLPGVARKTANVVLGVAYRIASGIVVDTHVTRVSRRLALTTSKDAAKVERDLCALFDRDDWIDAGHRLLLLGRYVCLAKNPDCANCPLHDICPSQNGETFAIEALGTWQQRAQHAQARIDGGAT
ncbi:MAG: endonuclease III [Planctomycetota bacterium]